MRSMSSTGVRLTHTAWELAGVQYPEGINFDGLKMVGNNYWTLASKNVRVEESNTRLEKWRATWNAYDSKTDKK